MTPPSIIPTSNSLWSPLDTVKDAAESLGVSNLSNEVSNVLAMDVEYRIFQIIEQALKFMRHSKRKTLSSKDINKALKVLNVEPLYGYDVSRPLNFKQALVGQALYYIDENMVDFEKLINSPLPKIPRLVTFTAHWLAIEGVQPNIPQNPLMADIKAMPVSERGSIQNLILDSNSAFEEVGKEEEQTLTGNEKSFENNLQVKPLIKHVISKELQLYFNKIIQVLAASPENNPEHEHLKNSALVSLLSDPGLHQLVPYFIQFISETITNNLSNISLLSIMLESIYSLLSNENIFLDPYIHSLLPCILTLLLAKKIGKVPEDNPEELQSYISRNLAIRGYSVSLLGHILKKYGSNYNTLRSRVARTLLKAFLQSSLTDTSLRSGKDLDSSQENDSETEANLARISQKNLIKNFGSYYGAIIGIKYLGNEVIRLILVGNLKVWSDLVLFDKLDGSENKDLVEREKQILIDTIVETLRELKTDLVTETSAETSGETPEEILKDKLTEKIGKPFTEEIYKQEDGESIARAIFFGQL